MIGNLGKDPEVRFMPDGGAVANLTIATSKSWKDKQTGESKEKTEWHRVVIFGKRAEVAGEYLKKGSKVYFEGGLQTRKWQNAQGQDQYTTEIVVDSFDGYMEMLDGRNTNSQANAEPANANSEPKGNANSNQNSTSTQAPTTGALNNSDKPDLPF